MIHIGSAFLWNLEHLKRKRSLQSHTSTKIDFLQAQTKPKTKIEIKLDLSKETHIFFVKATRFHIPYP